jgi:cyclopropane fatty-acyl-phospholipid synthase-like methyltransferase
MSDDRQFAPATLRNRLVILEILLRVLPPEGTILEIASGTGEHAVFFAPQLWPRQWIPSDANPAAIASIRAWQRQEPAENLAEPVLVDVTEPDWERQFLGQRIQAIVNINMIHISPWSACLGLMAGASRVLPKGGILCLYGPFKRHGQHTAPSNAEFDASLRSQNPDWGVRDLEAVVAAAQEHNLLLHDVFPMPANNLLVVWQAAVATKS